MAEALSNLLGGVLERWGALGPGQKFLVLSLGLGAAITVAVSLFLVNHVTYAVLYAGLDSDQASGVVDRLRESKTPFRLEDGGKTILVPEKEVYSVRLDMASEGGPVSGRSGYEIFDKSRFGMTSFMQQVNYRRALEGELTRTIREMDEVMAARVHLVIPERSLFVGGKNETTASVMLRIKPGVKLTRKQIEGITRLVSGSVESLEPSAVNVLDYYGNLLTSTSGADGFDAAGTERFEAESALALTLQEKAQTLLDRMVGPGNALVRITAKLDFERMERDSEIYDPDNASVRSEEVSEETGDAGSEYRNSVTNYELNKTVERVVKAPGSIERLTVAVTVGGNYEIPEGAEGENPEPVFVPRSAAELDEIAALVKNAVGVDETRGDQFHIACVELDREQLRTEREEMARLDKRMMIEAITQKALFFLVLLAAFLIVKKIFHSVAKTLSEAAPPHRQEALAPAAGGGPTGAPAPAAAPPLDERTRVEVASVAQRVSELAREKPEESADVIRTMLTEDG